MINLHTVQSFIDELHKRSGLYSQFLPSSDPFLSVLSEKLHQFYRLNGQDYLNSDAHKEIDERLGLASRSTTVIVRDPQGQILSTVRMSPFPFEAAELVSEHIQVDEFRNHIELSRLVSWPTAEYRTLPTAMALATALCAQHPLPPAGFVALSKTPQRRILARFGLNSWHKKALSLPYRAVTDYWFLQGSMENIVEHANRQVQQIREADPLFNFTEEHTNESI